MESGPEPLSEFEAAYQELLKSGKRISGNQFVKMANCRRQEGLAWFKQRRLAK